jgi:glycerol uptake facilitator-like aquaporin
VTGRCRLLVSAVVTALGLAVLILVFAPASGAHFNPLVTAADWLAARCTSRRYGPGLAVAVTGCQVAGAIGGTALANAMFAVPLLAASPTRRGSGPVLLGEVATAGLLLLIVTLARTSRTQHAAWSVGAWIGAAYWFTSSTSFANPAVTLGRTLTPTYAGIAPASAPAFIAAEIVGSGLGVLLAVAVHPAQPGRVPDRQPARLTWTGTCPTRPGSASTRSGPSVTGSARGYAR